MPCFGKEAGGHPAFVARVLMTALPCSSHAPEALGMGEAEQNSRVGGRLRSRRTHVRDHRHPDVRFPCFHSIVHGRKNQSHDAEERSACPHTAPPPQTGDI